MIQLIRSRAHPEYGFTVLELLIVVLVIGVLTATAVPVYTTQRNEAIRASMKADLERAALGIDTWAISQGTKKTPIRVENVELFKQIKPTTGGAGMLVIGYSHRYWIMVYHPNTKPVYYRSDTGGYSNVDPEFSWFHREGEVDVGHISIQQISKDKWRAMNYSEYKSVTF